MHILVINCGSSSVKAEVINTIDGSRLISALIERVNADQPIMKLNGDTTNLTGPGHETVLNQFFPLLNEKLNGTSIVGIGHRVVHGGSKFDSPVKIDETVEQTIDALSELAPLHNPINLIGIKIAKQYYFKK